MCVDNDIKHKMQRNLMYTHARDVCLFCNASPNFLSDILMNCVGYSVSLGWQTMAEMATLCIPVLAVGLRKGKKGLTGVDGEERERERII